MRKVVYALFAIAGLLAGCTSVDCSMNNIVAGVYGFRSLSGDSLVKLKDYKLTVAIGNNAAHDTLLNKQENVSTFTLPVSYILETDELHFMFLDSENDTVAKDIVRINKTNEPVFEGTDCGLRYHHKVLSATTTTNFLDSIVVNNDYISNDLTKVHFYLYLHPSDKSADPLRNPFSPEKD